MSYQISYSDMLKPGEDEVLFEGLNFEAFRAKGLKPIKTFAFLIKDEKNEVLGGIKGVTYYGCLFIDTLWVSADLRGKGWGTKLMHAAEKLGRERKCTFSTLSTMDWEGKLFYEKLGYQLEFLREGYEKDSKMYFMRKNL